MAFMTNHTDARVVVLGKTYQYVLPPMEAGKPKPTVEIQDADAEDWEARTGWADRGFVSIRGRKHWRTAVSEVKEIADLDRLEAMHESEDRPAVREAIEARMQELMQ